MTKTVGFFITTKNSQNKHTVSKLELRDLENIVYDTIMHDIKIGNTNELIQFFNSKFPNQTVVEFDVIENGFDNTVFQHSDNKTIQ